MATISQSQPEANTTSGPDVQREKEKALKPFVTDKDYQVFSENGRDLNACIAVFLVEMRQYVNIQWQEQYHIKEPLESLEQFNRDHLLEYPSYGGDAVLDDSFTGPDCPIEIFSPGSLQILSYFYRMNFHDFSVE
jgi:hypothetical protein